VEKARAKINLALNILGLLDDGYHEVEMIMQSVSLADKIILAPVPQGIKLINLKGEVEDELPGGKDNLAWQAAKLLQEHFPQKIPGVKIYLQKNIPLAAGLAGGSTDAAAVLRGLNRLFNLELSLVELQNFGQKLGMDVPFCLTGGTALATGRGEELLFLPDLLQQEVLLLNPNLKISTAEVYKLYDNMFLAQQEEKEPNSTLPDRFKDYSLEELVSLLKEKKEITWQEGWYNILQPVSKKLAPALVDLEAKLYSFGADHVQMSGSGPTLIAYFNDKRKLQDTYQNWPGEERLIITKFTARKYLHN